MTPPAQYILLNVQYEIKNIGIGSGLIFVIAMLQCIYTYITSTHSNEIKAMIQKAQDLVMFKLTT